jgi:D-alanyl-D-alanine endopeptidase (penicillin-binding protein 7)
MRLILPLCLLLFSAITPAKEKQEIFTAKSYLIADGAGQILEESKSDDVRPIASITKLMVALLVSEQDQSEMLLIPTKRVVQSSIPRNVISMYRHELLVLALVKSDNLAAQVLCENLPDCMLRMNLKALELGMHHTSFEDPTGLSQNNTSSATDLLKLLLVAGTNPTIANISSMPVAEVLHPGGVIKIKNTNPLTGKLEVLLSKTGFTNPAGGCLVMIVTTNIGRKIYILLGSKNTKTRIPEMMALVRK